VEKDVANSRRRKREVQSVKFLDDRRVRSAGVAQSHHGAAVAVRYDPTHPVSGEGMRNLRLFPLRQELAGRLSIVDERKGNCVYGLGDDGRQFFSRASRSRPRNRRLRATQYKGQQKKCRKRL
jgi:hypothetical protein